MQSTTKRLAAHLLQRCQLGQLASSSTSHSAGYLGALPCATGHDYQQNRGNHNVRVVLTEDHDKLGAAGSVVTVKSGYARHSLHPQKKAVYATPEHLRLVQGTSSNASKSSQDARLLAESKGSQETSTSGRQERQLQEIVETLTTKTIVARQRFRRKVEDQPPTSPVGRGMISKLVAKQLHIRLPPELLIMDAPIKDWGEYKVPLNLMQGDGQQAELRVQVLKVHRS